MTLGRFSIPRFTRVFNLLIILDRELRVNRQPHALALVLAGQFNRKLHTVIALGARSDIFFVMIGNHIGENRPQLHFSECAAGLNVSEHAFKFTHLPCDRSHFTQARFHFF